MRAARCPRCGTLPTTASFVCPTCHTLMIDPAALLPSTTSGGAGGGEPDPFLGAATTVDHVHWVSSVLSGADAPTLEAPAAGSRPARQSLTQPESAPASAAAPASPSAWAPALEDAPLAPSLEGHADPFAPRLSAALHLRAPTSAADSVVLGDARDIVGSALVDPLAFDAFLTAPTDAGLRAHLPVRVYLGRNLAEALTPEVVLRVSSEVDLRWVPLSSLERTLLAEIDGQRPVARVRARVSMTAETFGAALALLLDKGVVVVAGVAQRALPASAQAVSFFSRPSSSPAASSPAPAASSSPSSPRPSPSLAAPGPETTGELPVDVVRRAAHSIFASLLDEVAPAAPPASRAPDPARAAALHDQALRDLQTGDLARAWQLVSLAVELDPGNARYRSTIERWSEHVDRAMSGQVDSGERLYADALAAEHRADVVGALGLLRRCVVEHPAHAASWNRLGVLLLVHHRDIEAATAAFERAVLLDPVDVTYRNNLGKVLAVDDHPDVASRVTRRLRGR